MKDLPDTELEVVMCRPENRKDKIDELDKYWVVLVVVVVDNEVDNNMMMKLLNLKHKKMNHHLKNNNMNNRLYCKTCFEFEE